MRNPRPRRYTGHPARLPARSPARSTASSSGPFRGVRRGVGSDPAGSRPYRPGDDVRTIDWGASARLSAARGAVEFVVRERFAEQAPRVVLVSDRRPGMALHGPPWLAKPEVLAGAER